MPSFHIEARRPRCEWLRYQRTRLHWCPRGRHDAAAGCFRRLRRRQAERVGRCVSPVAAVRHNPGVCRLFHHQPRVRWVRPAFPSPTRFLVPYLISPCAKTGPGHRVSCSASCIPKRLLRALKSTNGTSDKHFSPPNSILNSYENDKLLPRIRWSVWQKTQPPKAGPWPYPPGHGPPAPAPPAKPIQPDLVPDAYNNM